MSECVAGHLSIGQVMRAANGESPGAECKRHLEECLECRNTVEAWREAMAGLEPLRGHNPDGEREACPSLEDLASYMAGTAGEQHGGMLNHLVLCERCAAVVQDVATEVEQAPALALRSGTAAWRQEMAERVVSGSSKPNGRRPAYSWFAAAAAVIMVLAGGLWWKVYRASSAEHLLARAYTAGRPFEYRLPDDGYSPLRQQRGGGSAFDRPEALIEAESAIQRRLGSQPENQQALALKGRAELLERDYEQAIETLERSRALKPDEVSVLTDLGAAYAFRGDVEKQNLDYGRALEQLLAALRKEPSSAIALFNAAIVYEKLALFDQAADTWKKLSGVPQATGWKDEAAARLRAIEQRRRRKASRENSILKDAPAFLAAGRLNKVFDPEAYHETFWQAWLPAATFDVNAKNAASLEASMFVRDFQDYSLEDALAQGGRGTGTEATKALAEAITWNQKGQSDKAMAAALEAMSKSRRPGLTVAAMRARLELAYASRRAALVPRCLDLSGQVLREAASLKYSWLLGYAHSEHALCEESSGSSGDARAELEHARSSLERAGLRIQALRVLGLITSTDNLIGNYASVWDSAPRGLTTYWSSQASHYRAQQFQYDLQRSATGLGWAETAAVMGRAAAESAKRAGNPEMEAVDRVELAGILTSPADLPVKMSELTAARKLVRTLPPGPTLLNLEWTIDMEQVTAAVKEGKGRDFTTDLDKLTARAATRTPADQIRLHETKGLALAAAHDWSGAETEFKQVIAWNQRHVSALASYSTRISELETASDSYRYLTEILLLRKHEAETALDVWRTYRGASHGAGGSQTITYAVLPSGIAVWSGSGKATHARMVGASAAEVEKATRLFVRMCASSSSNPEEIRSAGHRLYKWLIAEEIGRIPSMRIQLDADSWLSAIPFAALTDDAGKYLLQSRSFEEGGESVTGEDSREEKIGRNTRALVVSAPIGQTPGRTRLPVLGSAEQEANAVAAHFREPIVLRAAAADNAAIGSNASGAGIFHFAGHGWANAGNGALILPPGGDGESHFVTARELAGENWHHCSLAVLSACLTAAGEQRGPVNSQSLVRALLSAGAHCVIAARWSVDSAATKSLMERLYTHLFEGQTPQEALALAASDISAVREWAHPYYWAAFDVFGKP